MKNILLLKAGETALPVQLSAGDYECWFFEVFGFSNQRFTLVRPYLGQALPRRPKDFDALVMTGSPLSAVSPSGWMRRAADYLVEAAAQGVPILGVCFGHQLLGYAYGSPVIVNPNGREIGTVEIDLTPQGRRDPLFEGVPARFCAQATHEDIVRVLPRGAVPLARNTNTALQAMAIGAHVRGVQFHPELSPAGMRAVIDVRRERLDTEGQARGEPRGERPRRLFAGLGPSPYGKRILENFLRYFT